MDRDQLKSWLDEGLSLERIGAIVKRHPSTVGYWVKKHGLVANGKAKYAPLRTASNPLSDRDRGLGFLGRTYKQR